MGKVAFCWELGGGLGHIAGFLPVANHLKEKGHEVIFIVKSLLNTEQLVGQCYRHNLNSLSCQLMWYGMELRLWSSKMKNNLILPESFTKL